MVAVDNESVAPVMERSERGNTILTYTCTVPQVKQWTAETPWLYTLTLTAYDKKGKTEKTSIQIGFHIKIFQVACFSGHLEYFYGYLVDTLSISIC